jgi:hypothetical protein
MTKPQMSEAAKTVAHWMARALAAEAERDRYRSVLERIDRYADYPDPPRGEALIRTWALDALTEPPTPDTKEN